MLTNIFANNCKLHKFATTNSNFEKIDYFRHVSKYNEQVNQFSPKSGSYKSVKTVHTKQFAKNQQDFQQDWVSRSVKTVHTNLFTKICKLHKFATCE